MPRKNRKTTKKLEKQQIIFLEGKRTAQTTKREAKKKRLKFATAGINQSTDSILYADTAVHKQGRSLKSNDDGPTSAIY